MKLESVAGKMALKKLALRRFITYALWIAMPLFIAKFSVEFFTPQFAIWTNPCITKVEQSFINISGYDFQIESVDCDTIAKELYYKIYVTKTGNKARDLIFEYSPGTLVIPNIKAIASKKIQISVSDVGAVYEQQTEYKDLSIDYEIGQIDYPLPDK